MELIERIMLNIHQYCTDSKAVENSLYIIMQDYNIERKSTEIAKYEPDSNEALVKKFLVVKKIKGLTERTLKQYGMEIPKALERIGKNATDITTDDLRVWMALRVRDKVSKTTCLNEQRCMSTFMAWLYQEGVITKNPMAAIDTIKQQKTKKEAFKDYEIVKMRDALETTKDKCIFEMLLSTGCRVSELVGIRIDEINDDNSILVHGKGEKDRYVYLNPAAVFAIEKYMADRNDSSIWLFPRMKGIATQERRGIPISKLKDWYKKREFVDETAHADAGTIEHRIRTIGKAVGVKAYPHKFRRTCATNALKAGMPLIMVSKMLGHENVNTTQIYLDVNDDEVKSNHQKYVR